MKKLIAMLGAVAMSFGLFAADVATSFEAGDAGVTGGTTWTASSPWTWAAPITLATDGADRTLPYTAEGPMARYANFEAGNVNNNYLPLETGKDALTFDVTAGNVVIDQLVKFTGFEEPQELGDGDKIAVWMSEFPGETDDDPATVNLYVSCGQVGASSTTQYDAIAIEGASLDTWYRLTVKSVGNIYSVAANNREGFVVFVDGKPVKSTTTIAPEDDMTTDALALLKAGKLFPAFTASGTEFAQFQQVAYKGIGAIDDFVSTETCPEFTSAIEATITPITGAIVSAKDANGEDIAIDEDGKIAVEEDAMPITITFTADEGYVLATVTKEGVTFKNGDVLDYSDEVEPQKAILKVIWNDGDTEEPFASIATALVKVQELEESGEEMIKVEVGEDAIPAETIPGYGVLGLSAEAAITITPPDEWIIDGNIVFSGTIAGTVEVGEVTIPEEGAILLTGDGNLTTATSGLKVDTEDAGKKVVETDNSDDTYTYALEDVTYALTLTAGANTTLESDQDDDAKIPEGTLVKVTATPDEDFEFADESYEGWEKDGANLVKSFTMDDDVEIEGPAATQKETKIELTFTLPSDVLVTEVTGEGVEGNAQDGWKAPADTALTITVTAQNGKTFADGATKTVNATASAEAIDLTGVVPAPFAAVAKIGDTAFYATLPAAFTDATAGQTITLLADVVLDACIQVDKKVTLDIGDFDITANPAVVESDGDGANRFPASPKDSLIMVKYGADLTVIGDEGVIDASTAKIYSAIALTMKGDTRDENELAKLTVDANLKGYYYGITGNGTRPGTDIVINGGTIEGVNANDSAGIYNPQGESSLTVNAGTIQGASGIALKSGVCTVNIGSAAVVKATGAKAAYAPKGSGITITGDALILDNTGYPGGAPNAVIAGGTFISENGAAVASYADASKSLEPVTGFISGGKFKGAVATDTTLIEVSDEASKQGKWVEDEDGFLVPAEEPKTFALTLTAGENATIESDAADPTAIEYGTAVKVTTKPETGFEFAQASYVGWEFDEEGKNLVSNFVMTAATEITGPDATAESTDLNVTFTAPTGATVTMVEVGGQEVQPEQDGSYIIAKDATATVTLVADSGLYFANGTNTTTEDVTVTEKGAIPLVTPAPFEPVAMIGDKGYKTFKEAVEAATEGVTVVVVKDCKYHTNGADSPAADSEGGFTSIVTPRCAFTIDLNDHLIQINNQGQYGFKIDGASDVTIVDNGANGTGELRCTTYTGGFIRIGTISAEVGGGKLTLKSGTLSGRNSSWTSNVVASYWNGQLIVDGGTISTVGAAASADAIFMSYGSTATINGGVVEGIVEDYHTAVEEKWGTVIIPATSTARFDRDQTTYCASGYMTDDSQDGTATPFFVGAKKTIEYVYAPGTAPETDNKAAFAAYTADRTFTLAAPTPETDYDFTGWTTDATGVTFAGNDMTIKGDFGDAFTVTAGYAAHAYNITFGGAADPMTYDVEAKFPIALPKAADDTELGAFIGWTNETITVAITSLAKPDVLANIALLPAYQKQTWPSDWPEADPAVQAKFADWKLAYGVTEVTKEMEAAFLLNVDPKTTVPTLKIDSIEVDNAKSEATIVVSAGEKNLGEINGVLYVDVTDELGGEWATTVYDLEKKIEEDGTATFVVDTADGQFMKAKVGFKTPTK